MGIKTSDMIRKMSMPETKLKPSLLFDLIMLKIIPLNDHDVQKYKRKTRIYLDRKVLIVGLLKCILTGIVVGVGLHLLSIAMAASITLGCVISTFMSFFLVIRGKFDSHTWRTAAYVGYSSNHKIPSSVVEKAERIQKTLPHAVLYVEYIQQDPFLIVAFQNELYFVDVWGTPPFRKLG